jgi:hypothetical protein
MLRRKKPESVHALQARADASKALAVADAAAAKFAAEAELAQQIVTETADAIEARARDADEWDSQRAATSSRLDVAARTSFDLQERIERCRTMLDNSLKSGDVGAASSHGTALGSMQLTAQRASAIVEQLQNDYQSVPVSDLPDSERASIPTLRAIAKSPGRSHAHVVKRVDPAEEYRRLGRAVAAEQLLHPTFRNTPTPMRDARVARG